MVQLKLIFSTLLSLVLCLHLNDGEDSFGSISRPVGKLCPVNKKLRAFCIEAQVHDSSICFRMTSSSRGWFSFGLVTCFLVSNHNRLGKNMDDADVYTAFLNSSNVFHVWPMHANGRVTQPKPSDEVARDMDYSVQFNKKTRQQSEWINSVATFCRRINSTTSRFNVTTTSSYIFAFNDNKPEGNIDSPEAQLEFHGPNHGNFVHDFLTPSNSTPDDQEPATPPPPPKQWTFEEISRMHGLLMWIAWILIPIISIFTTRYLKSQLGSYWFTLHWALMGLGIFILTTVAFFLIYSRMYTPHFSGHSTIVDVHVKLGLLVPIMMIVQIFLGILADLFFDPYRIKVSTIDKVHWWIGRGLILAAIVNVTLGGYIFKRKGFEYATFLNVEAFHWSVLVLATFAFIVAERYLGSTHHVVDHVDQYDEVEELLEGDHDDI